MISVKKLPNVEEIKKNEIYEILTNNVGYFTHSFFKYPAKFIPQIPNWAINNFTEENDVVLDCFAGSGTTLVEASVNNRECLGVDFDKISLLLSEVKTTQLGEKDFIIINKILTRFDKKKYKNRPLPELKNLGHWFPEQNLSTLNALYYFIREQKTSKKVRNFLLVCYISCIRKSSYSDEQSPKPYVSTKHKKEPKKTFELFSSIVEKYIQKMKSHKHQLNYKAKFIGTDARNFKNSKYYNKVKLVRIPPLYKRI